MSTDPTHDAVQELGETANALAAAEENLRRIGIAYARAKARVDSYVGPLRGDLFEARVNAWRAATLALDRATTAYRRARVRHRLVVRRCFSEPEAA